MKKSLILGAAALAAVVWAPLANAGEVKLGGYYMGRWQAYDSDFTDETSNLDNGERYVHRLHLNMDMLASEKSHAHMRVRVLDSAQIEGADLGNRSDTNAGVSGSGLRASSMQVTGDGNITDPWEIRQAWLETEAWGVGIKFGEMPISLNDGILVGDDTSSNGGLLLSKTFGNTTVVLGNIRINEDGNDNTTALTTNDAAYGASADDSNLWAASLFGKVGMADYNFTAAYADIGKASDFMNVLEFVCSTLNTGSTCTTTDSSNLWLALTLSGKLGYVDAVGTVIYEDGYDLTSDTGADLDNIFSKSGWLGALRLKGSTGFGEWNAYGFYASEDFNNITNDNMVWSQTWDQGGPGGIDLLSNFSAAAVTFGSPSENMSGVGVGLKVMAGGWTINPMLDYAEVVEDTLSGTATSTYKNAWGGSLLLSTKIQKDTTLSLETAFADPKLSDLAPAGSTADTAFYAQAGIKMEF